MLKFDGDWRFTPPPDGQWFNQVIPREAIQEFLGMINKVATQGERRVILECFKGHFCSAIGSSHFWSSSVSWAETDLDTYMQQAAENAPLFLEAFFDACEEVKSDQNHYYAPDAAMINAACLKHGIGYELRPPYLVLREDQVPLVTVQGKIPTLAEEAIDLLQQSLSRSEELLSAGHGREAVQETLWLLESVSTAFRGLESENNVVQGKYFNQIVRELRNLYPGTTLDRVLDWTTALHGYLSSPTGGGIRHGLDLNEGRVIHLNEARLFCNLVRSYLSYLLSEHERITKGQGR